MKRIRHNDGIRDLFMLAKDKIKNHFARIKSMNARGKARLILIDIGIAISAAFAAWRMGRYILAIKLIAAERNRIVNASHQLEANAPEHLRGTIRAVRSEANRTFSQGVATASGEELMYALLGASITLDGIILRLKELKEKKNYE